MLRGVKGVGSSFLSPSSGVISVTTSTHSLSSGEKYLGVDYAGSCTITLGTQPNGTTVNIKDESGNASVNNIILVGTIDNDAGGAIIAVNNGALTLFYNNGWRIV